MKSIKHVLVLASIIILTASCSSNDDPIAINAEEVISTLTVTLTPENGGTAIVLKSFDSDGNGPTKPVVTVSGNLSANTTYTGATTVLNETVSPTEDITVEVLNEGVDHLFFYNFSNDLASTTYTDKDENGDPIGLSFTLTTKDAGAEIVNVTLRHEPNKSGANVVDGDITNAAGETDVAVTFNVTIE